MTRIKKIKYWFLFSLIIFTTVFYPAHSFAETDPDFLRNNNIPFFNPNDDTCSAVSSTGAGGVTSLQGNNNEQKIFNYLLAVGFTQNQAAGIMGSLQFEGGFSPFRQEESQSWPAGGYGIAQWTGGRRGYVTSALQSSPTVASIYSQYYSNTYGGGVDASTGFVPSSLYPDHVTDVNDPFLLGELNYLYQQELSSTGAHQQVVSPGAANSLQNKFNVSVTPGESVLDAIKAQTEAGSVAEIWTYTFEIPAHIQQAATDRAKNAQTILSSVSSGGTIAGGGGCAQQSTSGPVAQQIVAAAQKEAQGYSDGTYKAGSRYLTYTNNISTDWCAYFVTWILNEVGYKVNGQTSIGAVTDLQAALQADTSHFTWHDAGSYTPQPGDIAIYSGHTNIVVSATDATHVATIGGNQTCTGAPANYTQTIVCQDNSNYWPTNTAEPVVGYATPTGGSS